MIATIDIAGTTRSPVEGGWVRTILVPHRNGTRVEVSFRDVDAGSTWRIGASDRTQVAYVLEGSGATLTHIVSGQPAQRRAERGTGVYLEPGEDATVSASTTPLTLLVVTVPKHTGRPVGETSPVGYGFDEPHLRALVDEKRFRERTFWVNKETGLSSAWDLQLGRMRYAPHAHSPRHVHRASAASPVTPEHFYLIEQGRGEIKHDGGTLPVGPGTLVLIPAGEWHQLVASDTGFDYIEFQAPFDFVTTMDDDPLGKNWYIKGTDDGTGKPKLWVQS